jgi:hypothetical protein
MQLSSDQIWSLLFVAANEKCPSAFNLLVQYDKEHTHVFAATGKEVNTDNDSNSTSGATDLQQLEQLLLTCLAAREARLVADLIEEAPAVALLGELHQINSA